MTSFIEAIKKRQSVRSFKINQFNEFTLTNIQSIIDNKKNYCKKSHIRLKLLNNIDKDNIPTEKLGTYGVIKNCSNFILGLIPSTEQSLIDLGFVLEKIILELSILDIQSCWLGGTFSKSSFFEMVNTNNNEIIPVVIAIGVQANKRSLIDKTIRHLAKSHKRKDFNELFFKNNFYTSLDMNDSKIRIPLEMVRLAPSASNKQPWRIIFINNQFHIYLKRNNSYRKLIKTLKRSDLQKIDIGIAMCHLELSLNELNIFGEWSYIDENQRLPPENLNIEYIKTYSIKSQDNKPTQ